MKFWLGVLCAVTFIATLVFVAATWTSGNSASSAIAAGPQTPLKPVYGWQRVSSGTIEIAASDTTEIKIRAGKRRLSIKADFPVDVFTMTEDACSANSLIELTLECSMRAETTLWIKDGRTSEARAVNGIAAWLTKSSKAAERAIAPNRVHIEGEIWNCIENCPLKSRAPAATKAAAH